MVGIVTVLWGDYSRWQSMTVGVIENFIDSFIFFGLAWTDIQILAPDLDSPEHSTSGDI